MSLKLTCECTGKYIFHDRKEGPICSKCGSDAVMGSLPASVNKQMDVDYDCPVTGKPIRSKYAHEENLKLHGAHVFEKGEGKDAERNRKLEDEKFEALITESAVEFVHNLSPEAKAVLEQELTHSEIQTSRGSLK